MLVLDNKTLEMKTLYLFIFGALFVVSGSAMFDLTKLVAIAGSLCVLGGLLLFGALLTLGDEYK